MALGSDKTWAQWIDEYSLSHQNPVNRVCHFIGIPMILVALFLMPIALRAPVLWRFVIFFFVLGWLLQFLGHAFEGKLPEFFRDWRFLFVGLRWWVFKVWRNVK